MENEEDIKLKLRQLGNINKYPNMAFKRLYKQALDMGLNSDDIASLESIKGIQTSGSLCLKYIKNITIALSLILITACLSKEKCIVSRLPLFLEKILREFTRAPVENCDFCRNVSKIEKVSNIKAENFESLYAYSGVPVIITDASKNWTANDVFSFEFFKSLYPLGSPTLENTQLGCQFFPYKTNFSYLGEVFSMSDDRANLKDGSEPWYIGWNNCDLTVADILRKHYQRPYFLPRTAGSMQQDWIFMGSPGYGAHLHLDKVKNPSWQAQITGTKKWTLEPPSECYFECKTRIDVTVYPGEIIVLDTNKWYHATLIVGNDISIAIGSEYFKNTEDSENISLSLF